MNMGTFEGPSAIRGFWEDWWSSYEHLQIDVLEILEAGNGVVVATFLFKGLRRGPRPSRERRSRSSTSGRTVLWRT
jgi:hypothetical protein